MQSKGKKKDRQSGIELLRICAALGVIILHYNNINGGGGFMYAKGANLVTLFILESLCVVSVNIFILINGYFSYSTNKRDLYKPFSLIFQIVIFNEIHYLLCCSFRQYRFSFHSFAGNMLPINWFVIIYCSLYLLSPFINIIAHSISKKNFERLLFISFFIVALWPTIVDILEEVTNNTFVGLNSVSMYGDQSGYSLVNFCFLYLIGCYLRKYPLENNKIRSLWLLFICNLILLTGWSYFEHMENLSNMSGYAYCNPVVIVQSVIIFLLFQKCRLQSKVINNLSQASFCCYLIHGYFIKDLQIQKYLSYNNLIITLVHVLLCISLIYFFSWIINLLYTATIKKVCGNIAKYWKQYRYYDIELDWPHQSAD